MTTPRRPILRRLEATEPPLYDELLEEIFLRFASPADLARASAVCASFRRIIADPSFLRRYRSLHPPLLLGVLCDDFHPAEAPHPNAPAARALAGATGFSFDYLPGGSWQRCDVCDGRVLLERIPEAEKDDFFFPELAVCDPLSRRYLLLPPIPDDLVASVQVQKLFPCFEAFLVPSRHEEETSFQVIARTHCMKKLVIFIFSSGSSRWSVGTSTSWVDLSLNTPVMATPPGIVLGWPQYENGCFYWKVNWGNTLLKLDINKMEFSTVDLPTDHDEREVVIVEAGEGRLAMFSLVMCGTSVQYFTSLQNEGEGGNEWPVENTIPLPCKCNIVGASEGYIFLLGVLEAQSTVGAVCFSLEIKTFKIERLSSIKYLYVHVHPYFGFPPFMSPRRI